MTEIETDTVKFENQKIRIDRDDQPSGRLLPKCHNYHEVEMGDKYWSEWVAYGRSEDDDVAIYWIFEQSKGEEDEPDMLDWSDSNIDRVEIV